MIKFRLCTIITVASVRLLTMSWFSSFNLLKSRLGEMAIKSLHLSKTNFTQVKDQWTTSEIFIFGGESTWIWLIARPTLPLFLDSKVRAVVYIIIIL